MSSGIFHKDMLDLDMLKETEMDYIVDRKRIKQESEEIYSGLILLGW